MFQIVKVSNATNYVSLSHNQLLFVDTNKTKRLEICVILYLSMLMITAFEYTRIKSGDTRIHYSLDFHQLKTRNQFKMLWIISPRDSQLESEAHNNFVKGLRYKA